MLRFEGEAQREPSAGPVARRGSLRRVGAALGLAVALVACDRGEVSPSFDRPSVLLVTIDTLRADRVGVYGAAFASTPTLDRLAADGTRFETAVSSSPLTLPSHASLLTGRQPPGHGVRNNGSYRLAPEIETLAERLAGAGYATRACVGAFVLAARFGLDQGFEVYDDRMSSRHAVTGGFLERRAEAVTDCALEQLEEARAPFFLWTHYYDPHAEYAPPPRFAPAFGERPYDGEIAYVDEQIGRMLEGLRRDGRLERTLVVVTADHGEAFGEHGEETHSYTLYDATLHVPLLVRGPGVPVGRVVPGVVRSVDVAPTLLSLLRLPPLAGAQGEDLSPLWGLGAEPSERLAYAETLATQENHGWAPLFALRGPHHHYVKAPRPELYALDEDPKQLRNLLEQDAEAEAARVAVFERGISEVLERGAGTGPERLDAATRSQLAALGYAGGEPLRSTGLDPKDGLRWLSVYSRALQLTEVNRLEEAHRLLDDMVTALPESSLAHALLARVLVLEGHADRALPEAREAVRLQPDVVFNLTLLGDVQVHLGDRAGAEATYRAAAALDPGDPLVQIGLMWAEVQAGRVDAAEEIARRAREASPSATETANRIATVWEHAGEYERALEVYQRSLSLDPEAQDTHMYLAIQYARLGRESLARAHLVQAGSFADVPHLRNRLGIVYAARGDSERAEAIFRGLLDAHPAYPTPRRNLATLLRQQGRAAEAEALEASAGT